jgi:hypothetical protein
MTIAQIPAPSAPLFPLLRLPQGLAGDAQRLAASCAGFLLALTLPTVLAYAMDDRQLNAIDVWIKPFHFQLALSVHFATLAALTPLVGPHDRQGRLLRWSMLAAVGAAVFEIAYIMTQAARGRHSHFNVDTPIEAVLYPIMGIGSIMLVTVSFIVGILIWKQRRMFPGSGLRSGAALGLVIGSLATLAVAGFMSSGDGHWVGGLRTDAGGLPITGWSTTGGDLRVPHFFATHMMQALPLAGVFADRWLPGAARDAVWAATAVWMALILGTFAQALRGLPLLGGF